MLILQIDRSIIESFGDGGKACITSRVYPLLAIEKDAHLYVFNNGSQSVVISQLNAWSMKQAEFATESIIIWKVIQDLFNMICMCCMHEMK
jgi:beta-fructofuranosidase